MEKQQLQQQVRELVAEILEVEPNEVSDECRFREDLDADSMSALELMARLESEFRIVIGAENLPEMVSLPRVVALLEQLLNDS